MSDSVRAFLAVEIPSHIREALNSSRQPLQRDLPRARWVRPEGQHLTLKFLGDAPPSVLHGMASEMTPVIGTLPRVPVQLGGAGFFPSPKRPRVAWVGGRADGMDRAVEVVEEIADRYGFSRERRRWSLHLTQARLNRPWPPDAVDRFLEWGAALDLESFIAGEVVMFKSDLQPTGAVYTALERMPLS